MLAYITATYTTAWLQLIVILTLAASGPFLVRRYCISMYTGLTIVAWIIVEAIGLTHYRDIGSWDKATLFANVGVGAASDFGWFFAVWLAVLLSRKLRFPLWLQVTAAVFVALVEPAIVAAVMFKTVAAGYSESGY